MLKTIIEYIDKIHLLSFYEYYQSYILKVQDSSIDLEFQYMLQNNIIDVKFIDRAIVDAYKQISDMEVIYK